MADIGRVALPLAGVVGGFILGGPIGASIGFAIGTGLGYLLFPPEGKTIEGPRLDDLKVTFSSYGKPIPRIYGTMETGGNVVWSPGLEEHRVEEEVGGKGAPSVTSVSFLYTASYRINYSVGVADSILRNWADGKLIIDKTGVGPVSDIDTRAGIFLWWAVNIVGVNIGPGNPAVRDFLGTTTQLPGPAEQADKGIANTPAYRGTVGQEWEDMALEDYGNRIPQLTAEIAMAATDPFNFTRVTPDTTVLTETAWYSPNPGVVYLGDQAINRIDFVGNNVLTVPGWATGRVVGLDEFDRLWVREGSSNVTFKLYDASTRELLITGTDAWTGVTGGFASNVRFIMFLENSALGVIAVSESGQLAQLVPDLVNLDIDLIRDSADASPYHLNTWFPGTYDVGTNHQWVLDSNLDPWMTANKGADGSITRFDRVTGDPVEQIVLTSTVVTRIAYYAADNAFILQNGNNIIKYSLDSMSIVDTLATTIVSGKRNNAIWQVIDDRMYIQEFLTGNGGVYGISGDTIIRESNFRPNDWVGGVSNMEAYLYDPLNDAIIVTGTSGSEDDKYLWLYLNRATGDDITVRSVVEDISLLNTDWVVGTDIDATELTDTFPGYIVRTRITKRKALEPLATAFNFRSVESDFKIKFPKRGGASIGNIPQIDLGATAGEVPTTQPLMKTRLPEDQLFETAIIEYIDPTFDNNPNTQQAKRSKEAIDVGGSLKFDFPGALGNDQAAQIIERILFQAWAGRTNISTPVPLKHILKDPGDVVTVTKDGKTVQVELHDVRLGANSIIKIEGTIDDSAVHTSTATGADAEGEEGQVIILTGSTEFFILDINLLRDVDEGDGIYVPAGTAEGTSWPGAAIFRGLDTTSIHPFVGITSSRNFDYGFATTVLATFSPDIWDRTNTVTISLTSGTLSSDTEINVLNGANALLIGDEIVQFATAVLNANGTYTISTLLRGRRGTEWASGTHVVNERVIVLSASTLLRVDVDLSDHLSTFFYKAMTLGSSQFSSKTIEQVLNLNSQKPYAPSHLAGTRPANDWLFTLIRRTRVGGAWRDFVDVPLSELSENYEWDVMNGSIVERTLTSVVESVTYTEADQITDFGSVQDSVELNVYQLSDTIGRGYVTNVTIGL